MQFALAEGGDLLLQLLMQDLRAEQLIVLVEVLRDHFLNGRCDTSVIFQASSW
jgi:hypothetical protein